MNEFSLIDTYFKTISPASQGVVLGIGDDAACLHVPNNMDLLVSTDTLVSGVHFLEEWSPYDIASRAVRVNVSDIAAMGGTPCWVSLALTLPQANKVWLDSFSKGLAASLHEFDIALIGGDTTRGPLSITLTIQGLTLKGNAIRRSGAKPEDKIFVTGNLGAAAQAVAFLKQSDASQEDGEILMEKLLHPKPRLDLVPMLKKYATSAIDISDGLCADLGHILQQSNVGARLELKNIPIHPLVVKYQGKQATHFAMTGGDDYELCFTVNPLFEEACKRELEEYNIKFSVIGEIKSELGLKAIASNGNEIILENKGFSHF